MAKRYFKLRKDMQSGTWDLGDPLDAQGQEVDDPWMFRAGRPVHVAGRLTIPVEAPGRRAELAPNDVQLIPVDVQGQPDPYLMLVATKLIRCINDEASEEVQYWKPEDERPDKLGQYRAVSGMRIDRAKVGDAQVFRTWGWNIALIVSEDIKEALERAKVSGARFTEV